MRAKSELPAYYPGELSHCVNQSDSSRSELIVANGASLFVAVHRLDMNKLPPVPWRLWNPSDSSIRNSSHRRVLWKDSPDSFI
jgi:hypothetical protein